jgi:type IV pilus assembly protein PilC
MAGFTVEAMDNAGKKIKVDVEAASANEAMSKIKGRGFKPVTVKEKAGAGVLAGAAPGASGEHKGAGGMATGAGQVAAAFAGAGQGGKKARKSMFMGRVKHKQLTQFTQQLSVLMDAGLPVVRSLKILANQMRPSLLKNIASEVAEDVETGSSLSEALNKHPKTFDKLYVNMVKAGEAGGVLDVILQRLAGFMERMEALKRKIIGASIYPIVVIIIAIAVVLAIMTFIVPKFEDSVQSVKVNMPPMTVALMGISNFVKTWFVLIFAPIILYFIMKA